MGGERLGLQELEFSELTKIRIKKGTVIQLKTQMRMRRLRPPVWEINELAGQPKVAEE
jgi:hypothetical protein